MKGNKKTILLYVVLLAGFMLISLTLLGSAARIGEPTYGEIIEMFRDNVVTEYQIASDNVLTSATRRNTAKNCATFISSNLTLTPISKRSLHFPKANALLSLKTAIWKRPRKHLGS